MHRAGHHRHSGAPQAGPAAPERYQASYSFRAYLGLSYVDEAGQVRTWTDAQFDAFLPQIAAAFPEGFSLYGATGGYQPDGALYTEPARILEVVALRAEAPAARARVEALARAYSLQYKQRDELIVATKVKSLHRAVPAQGGAV